MSLCQQIQKVLVISHIILTSSFKAGRVDFASFANSPLISRLAGQTLLVLPTHLFFQGWQGRLYQFCQLTSYFKAGRVDFASFANSSYFKAGRIYFASFANSPLLSGLAGYTWLVWPTQIFFRAGRVDLASLTNSPLLSGLLGQTWLVWPTQIFFLAGRVDLASFADSPLLSRLAGQTWLVWPRLCYGPGRTALAGPRMSTNPWRTCSRVQLGGGTTLLLREKKTENKHENCCHSLTHRCRDQRFSFHLYWTMQQKACNSECWAQWRS